jgi:hypothetical protein
VLERAWERIEYVDGGGEDSGRDVWNRKSLVYNENCKDQQSNSECGAMA